MKAKSETIKLWSCPKCGRQFKRQGQSHSCRLFPVEQHFEGKPEGKQLYRIFKMAVRKHVGPFKIESLECCIHFVSTFTFVAVKILRDKISVDFSLSRKIRSNRISHVIQMSARRYLYVIDILKEDEIDEVLLKWIKEAINKNSNKTKAA